MGVTIKGAPPALQSALVGAACTALVTAPPSAHLLQPMVFEDVCTAARLLMEAVMPDPQAFTWILACLHSAVTGAIAAHIAHPQPPWPAGAGGAPEAVAALRADVERLSVAAAVQRSCAALAVLHACMQQLGAALVRSIAGSINNAGSPSAAVSSALASSSKKETRGTTSAATATRRSSAVPPLDASSAAPGAKPAGPPQPQRRPLQPAPAAAQTTAESLKATGMLLAAAAGPHVLSQLLGQVTGPAYALMQHPQRPHAQGLQAVMRHVSEAVALAAAGGLLEGAGVHTRLQPAALQPWLQQLLQPGFRGLVAAIGALASILPRGCTFAHAQPMVPQQAAPHGVSASGGGAASSSAMLLLCCCAGYCWARMKGQPATSQLLPELQPLQPGTSGTASGDVSPSLRHRPVIWCLEALLAGSLGAHAFFEAAAIGMPPEVAGQMLAEQTQGPLFRDTQALARLVVDVAASHGSSALPQAVAQEALEVVAVAMRELRQRYAALAGCAAGRAWLGSITPAGSAALRETLERTFVVATSLLSVLLDSAERRHKAAAGASPAMGARWAQQQQQPAALAPKEPAAGVRWSWFGRRSAVGSQSDALAAPAAAGTAASAAAAAASSAAAEADRQACNAVAMLSVLADLQFCAINLRLHAELVTRLSAAVTAAPATALPLLLAQLPCYSALVRPDPDHADRNTTAAAPAAGDLQASSSEDWQWHVHGVEVSRLAFLLPLVAPHLVHAPDLMRAASQVLPFVYLLLRHTPDGVAAAMHAVWAALLSALCAEHPGDSVDRRADGEQPTQRQQREQLAQAMVAYYVRRTLQEPCPAAHVEGLAVGLRQVMRCLPVGDACKVWCMEEAADAVGLWASELAMKDNASSDECPGNAGAASSRGMASPASEEEQQQPGAGRRAAQGAADADARMGTLGATLVAPAPVAELERLAKGGALLGLLLLEVDYPLLAASMQRVQAVVAGTDLRCRVLVLQQLHDAWVATDEYARRQLLMDWLHSHSSSVPVLVQRSAL